MNYSPYFGYPYMNAVTPAINSAARASGILGAATKTGGLKGLLGGIKWGAIVNGTQKTLGIVNQAIPLIRQAKPVVNNAKTMFKVMNEFKKVDTPITTNQATETVNKNTESETITNNFSSGPTFFQ